MQRISKRRNSRNADRRGVAATELAVCLPVLLLLVIGTIEASTMIYLKQSLAVSAYEGVRAAIQPGAETGDVLDSCQRILNQRNVKEADIQISPTNFASQAPETWVQIEITAPCNSNSVFPGWFYNGQELTSSATMMIEY